jgi:outer membrane biosynthesis protein TonB
MAVPFRSDAPWQRLPWLLPVALSLSLAALDGFHHIMGEALESAPPTPVEVSLVELPPPPAVAPASPAEVQPTPVPQAEAPPPRVPPPQPQPKPAPPPASIASAPPRLPPEAAKAAPPRAQARTITPKLREITRQVPGMTTAPLLRSEPPTEEQWRRLSKTYHTGEEDSFSPLETREGPRRAAASARLPPLTKEQWAKLDQIYHVGEGIGATNSEVMKGSIRAARSVRLPPLTRAQWAALDRIYHVGETSYTDPVEVMEATRRAALSISMALTAPGPVVDPSRPTTWIAHNGMAARAIEQPLPTLPDDLVLDHVLMVTARFRIAADGSATVELTKPTAQAKLDGLLLAALQKWRFAPAYENGHPVASTLELQLTIAAR